mmetsp:Transcript_7948/g.11104  ORF Transcript_7948/g.11104 Transcript_7948/m.11104 type:complete len:257 (+) Transcript_7948:80-850(+)
MFRYLILGLLLIIIQQSFQFSLSASHPSPKKVRFSNLHSSANYLSDMTRLTDTVEVSEKEGIVTSKSSLSMNVKGGSDSVKSKFGLASTWGVVCVLSVLYNAIKRLSPVAFEVFGSTKTLSPVFWASYASFVAFMAYTEGYKAFQKKFSPLVVKRALTLDEKLTPMRAVFAGPYCMGMFHATKARKIVSWSITIGVFGLVQVVKRLPFPYRSLVDAGVVAGLSWGGTSILCYYVRSLFGTPPSIDPALPKAEEKNN